MTFDIQYRFVLVSAWWLDIHILSRMFPLIFQVPVTTFLKGFLFPGRLVFATVFLCHLGTVCSSAVFSNKIPS